MHHWVVLIAPSNEKAPAIQCVETFIVVDGSVIQIPEMHPGGNQDE